MKKYNILITILVFSVFFIQIAQALSLKQKKFKKQTEEKIEKVKKDMQKSCGCVPQIEVAWDNLQTRDDFLIPSRSLSSVRDGMARLCKNYKKEVCAGVKSVHIFKGELHKSFSKGVLKIGRKDYMQGWGGQQISELLEENL